MNKILIKLYIIHNFKFNIFYLYVYIIYIKFAILVSTIENGVTNYPIVLHKSFNDILSDIKIEKCKSAKTRCSEFVKKYILDFNSRLINFHWIYKSEKFSKLLLNRIKIKEECKKLKSTENTEDTRK